MHRPSVLACAAAMGVLLGCGDSSQSGFFTEPVPLPSQAEPLYDPDSYPRSRLDNGLVTLMLEIPDERRVTLGIRLRRGAGSVDRGRAGLAALTAALMRRGAGELDARDLLRRLRSLKTSLDIDAKWDVISVKLTGPARNLTSMVEVLADVVIRPQLDEKQFDHATMLLLTKVRNPSQRPMAVLQRHAAALLYPNHRAGLPLNGTEATLRTLSVEDVRAFHSEMFVPSNALFFASGGFDADELLALVRDAFSGWTAAPAPPDAPPRTSPAPPSRRIWVIDRPKLVESTHVLLAQDGVSRQSPDRAGARLLNDIIERNAIIKVSSDTLLHRGGGYYTLRATTSASKARRVVDLLLSELERVRERPIPEDELERVKRRRLARFDRSMPGPKAVLQVLIELDSYEMPDDSRAAYRESLVGATPDSLRDQAGRLLHPERAAIFVIGPAAEIAPQLEGLGEVEVIAAPPEPATESPTPGGPSPSAAPDAPDALPAGEQPRESPDF